MKNDVVRLGARIVSKICVGIAHLQSVLASIHTPWLPPTEFSVSKCSHPLRAHNTCFGDFVHKLFLKDNRCSSYRNEILTMKRTLCVHFHCQKTISAFRRNWNTLNKRDRTWHSLVGLNWYESTTCVVSIKKRLRILAFSCPYRIVFLQNVKSNICKRVIHQNRVQQQMTVQPLDTTGKRGVGVSLKSKMHV